VLIGRVWNPAVGGPAVVVVRDSGVFDLSTDFATTRDITETEDPARAVSSAGGTRICGLDELLANSEIDGRNSNRPWVLSPIDLHVVKAAGVTFPVSMIERVIEEHTRGDRGAAATARAEILGILGGALDSLRPGSPAAVALKADLVDRGWWSQYLEVGIGPDAEVFTKAPTLSSVGSGSKVGVLSTSRWNNPEPELVLVVNSRGVIVGATLGNDVNLRDVEGRSALLLPKAKDNNASAAIGPFIRLFDHTYGPDDLLRSNITLTIEGRDGYRLEATNPMAAISRTPTELVSQVIGPHHQYPDGFVLYCGTLFTPTDDRDEAGRGFHHKVGDVVCVSEPWLGTLINAVEHSELLPPWDFGIDDLYRNLAARGLLTPAAISQRADTNSSELLTTDPRTGNESGTGLRPTTDVDVDRVVRGCLAAQRDFEAYERVDRARLLDACADTLEAHRDELALIADRETALGVARLTSEVNRSAFQFRFFADVIREGSYLGVAVDHAADTVLAPAPEVRRMLFPLGVVAVFGASNFPFAFSCAGGDVASALAAGNAVVIKAHESHLKTSQRTFELLSSAAAAWGAPHGLLGIVYGRNAGSALVSHPDVSAVGFTGSITAARVLMNTIADRPNPIPFYGELSSVNPLVISPGAAQARGPAIADGLHSSFTLGAGQFCTKPGLAFIPAGDDGDQIVNRLLELVANDDPQTLLNDRIRDSFNAALMDIENELKSDPAAVGRDAAASAGFACRVALFEISTDELRSTIAREVFGPSIIVVRYDNLAAVYSGLDSVPHSLTATLHHEESERELVETFTRIARVRAGRILYNGYPTGVRVSWAQHHGGPWPATNTQHSSVGADAIVRFLRPIAFQSAPSHVLPRELRDEEDSIPRRIDGTLTINSD